MDREHVVLPRMGALTTSPPGPPTGAGSKDWETASIQHPQKLQAQLTHWAWEKTHWNAYGTLEREKERDSGLAGSPNSNLGEEDGEGA